MVQLCQHSASALTTSDHLPAFAAAGLPDRIPLILVHGKNLVQKLHSILGMGFWRMVARVTTNGRISANKAITPRKYSVRLRAGTALFQTLNAQVRAVTLHSQHDLRITAGREPLQARREDAHTAMLCPLARHEASMGSHDLHRPQRCHQF